MKMNWQLMKEIVKELRIKQVRLVKKQGGYNEVQVTMAVYHPELNDRIVFYPHSLNMTTGVVWGRCGGRYGKWNIKDILKLERR